MNRDREFLAVPSWHPEAVLCVKAADNAALRELLREWQRVYSTRSNIYYATDAALKGDKP